MLTFLKHCYFIIIVALFGIASLQAQSVAVENVIFGQPDFLVTNGTFDLRKGLQVDVENSTGKKVFVWQEFDAGSTISKNIRCAVYNSNLTLISSFILNSGTTGDQMSPVVKVNQEDNSFVVGWVSWIDNGNTSDPSKYDIYAKKIRLANISTDAAASDLLVNTNYTIGRQYAVSLAYDYAYNELVVGWIDQDGQDRLPTVVANDNGSYARRLNNAGNALSLISGANQFQIITTATLGHQSLNALEVSPVTGELYSVSFSYNFPSGSSSDIIFKKFTRGTNGNYVAGVETIVNTTLTDIQYTGYISVNSITGDYVIGWTSENQDGSGKGAYMRVYDKYNVSVKAETRINQVASGNQLTPRSVWDEGSNSLVFYYWYSVSQANIRYQIFDGNNNYAYVGVEVSAEATNLVDAYAGQFVVRYDQMSKRVFLSYDEFSGANTRGWYRQFIFTPAASSVLAAENRNYVQTRTITQKRIKQEAVATSLSELSSQTTREYIDGLGRSIQQVMFKASPLKKDLVQPIAYDNDRQRQVYLPYAASTGDISFKSNVFSDQGAFYNNNTSSNADRVVNDVNPFSINNFDNSPLDRVLETYSPGASWQQTVGFHSIRTSYRVNATGEVKKWIYDPSTYVADGNTFYNLGELTVKQITDEDGNKSWEYSDKQDRIVLSKKQDTTSSDLETYYVYDDIGNLRFVIPPLRASLTSLSYYSTDVSRHVYCYTYDAKHRLIEKSIPGGGIISYIYDKLDRQILSQTSNQIASKQWSYTKYDALNRIVMTGLYTHSQSITSISMQTLVDANVTPLNESKLASTTHGYSNVAWPSSNTQILTVNYYDNYDFDYNGTADFTYQAQGLIEEASPYNYTGGLLTGTKNLILNTTDWLRKAFFYDKNYRIVQVQKNNHKNLATLADVETTVYDFTGNVIYSQKIHNPGSSPITVLVKQSYDHFGRATTAKYKVNTDPEILLSSLKYNELGQLIEKNLHSENNGSTFLQSIDYTYNIRGWIQSLNNSSLTNDGVLNNDANDLFGMEYLYETTGDVGNTPRFDGNITGIKWKGANSGTSTNLRSYRYRYDGTGRLREATYGEKPAATWNFPGTYDENITYDKNGNINVLARSLVNQSYSYTGNQLSTFNGNAGYTYDMNGNMTSDGVNGYSYNHLNLISGANINTAGLNVTYSATGEKLKRVLVVASPTQPTVDYIDEFVYKDGVLTQFATPEGRVEPNGAIFNYIYDIKDHLGNLRMSFDRGTTGTVRIIQESHYYPFGMNFSAFLLSGSNQLLYNGKESQSEVTLYDLYDYGARMYNVRTGRWMTLDPKAQNFSEISPYCFSFNNPLRYLDKDGKAPQDIIITGSNNSSVTIKTDLIDVTVNASSLGIDFGGNYSLHGEEILSAGLDLAGIADPTGIADGLNAGLQAKNGDWLGAGISVVGIIPYIGDAAKLGKISKDVKVIERAIDGLKTGDKVASTSRAARREAMRDAGIPTSQTAKSQSKNTSGREYSYETPKSYGGSDTKSVQQQTKDRSHDHKHWEAGKVKKDKDGEVRKNNYDRPRLDSDKSKVYY